MSISCTDLTWGEFTLTESETETDKNGLYVWRCSYCTETETETGTMIDVIGFQTHFIGLGLCLCQCEQYLDKKCMPVNDKNCQFARIKGQLVSNISPILWCGTKE